MTSFTVGRIRIVYTNISHCAVLLQVEMATYVLILSSVRALFINQGRVRLDNVVLYQAVELFHEEKNMSASNPFFSVKE